MPSKREFHVGRTAGVPRVNPQEGYLMLSLPNWLSCMNAGKGEPAYTRYLTRPITFVEVTLSDGSEQ